MRLRTAIAFTVLVLFCVMACDRAGDQVDKFIDDAVEDAIGTPTPTSSTSGAGTSIAPPGRNQLATVAPDTLGSANYAPFRT